ncbi:MAG TPA: MMPL family transporter, partial [Opitutaceae bacterium]|nr:MMPL family transporter [Opitutaceae bacterium]
MEFSRRHAATVAVALLVLAVAGGYWVSQRIAIDSNTGKLVDPNLPWQQASADLDRQFPQNQNLLVAVVDGQTPDQASDAAADLETAMKRQPQIFQYVRRPDADPYLLRYGMLFMPTAEVQDFADHLIAAQPFLGTLAADPSARGVLGAIDLLAVGALHGQADAARIDAPLTAVAAAAEAAAAGRQQPLAWQNLLSGRKAQAGDLRHFVLSRPVLNYGQVDAATQAIAALRADAKAAGLDAAHGVRVRVTGPVALNNDQLAVLAESAASSTLICFGLLALWLAAGVRSIKTLAAILLTLAAGLVGCAVFAVGCIGALNPVSIAFGPLFIGIAIDFGIQFSVRYAADRLAFPPPEAFRATAAGVGPPLTVAAAATAAGFLSFAPTSYLGVRDLGLIAGAGMLVALFLNLTLLPALLTLFRVGPDRHAAGFSWGAALDRVLLRRRGRVVVISLLAAAASLAVLPRLKLDFNPVDLEDPHAESVRTLLDLMADPGTSPYTIEFLAPRAEA